jgi:hypothetical protein
MNDDEILKDLNDQRDKFELAVFEFLFGDSARPEQTVEEYRADDSTLRIFSYEEATIRLAEVGKSLQLLHMIKEHLDTNGSWCGEEDTDENYQMRELIDRLARELPTTGE